MFKNDKFSNINEFSLSFDAILSDDKYSMKKTESIVQKIPGGYNCLVELEIKVSGNAKWKLFAAYLGEKGKELAKDYIEPGKSFVTVPGTKEVKIELIAYSKSGGRISADRGILRVCDPVKKRKVVVAAVGDAYRGVRSFETNLNNALEIIDEISVHKPDIIALSEAFYGRQVPLSITERALNLDSEPVKKLCEKAKEHNTYLCFSIHAYNKSGNIQNMAVLVNRKGEIEGTYAKTHLTMGEYSMGMEPGDEPVVFETDFGKIGICICWDLFFPEFVRRYHLEEVDLIINPTAGFDAARTVERAKECGAHIIVSGTKRNEHTRIVSPAGKVLDKGSPDKRYAVAEIDLNEEHYVWYLSSSSYSTRKNVFKYERVPELYK